MRCCSWTWLLVHPSWQQKVVYAAPNLAVQYTLIWIVRFRSLRQQPTSFIQTWLSSPLMCFTPCFVYINQTSTLDTQYSPFIFHSLVTFGLSIHLILHGLKICHLKFYSLSVIHNISFIFVVLCMCLSIKLDTISPFFFFLTYLHTSPSCTATSSNIRISLLQLCQTVQELVSKGF